MSEQAPTPQTLSELDRPNSYIGKSVPRPNLDRLLQGRGLYVSDMELPRMAHVVFVRSPHAHAKIVGIDTQTARKKPGVVAVITGEELAAVITPWVGVLSHLKARHRDRSGMLAGRGGRSRYCHEPRSRRRRGRIRRGGIPGA
jgi:carbon-monoxide dehydrogenase large subunit